MLDQRRGKASRYAEDRHEPLRPIERTASSAPWQGWGTDHDFGRCSRPTAATAQVTSAQQIMALALETNAIPCRCSRGL